MTNITCSIVINTYNREPYLRRLLASLGRLRGPAFEVIVVDGPSTDGTEALLAEFAGRIKIAHCPDRNLSHSRNIGIAEAAGDLVVFIDDDALPADEDWLARYVAAIEADRFNQIGAIGGRVFHRDTTHLEFNGGATADYGQQIFDGEQIDMSRLDRQRWVAGVCGCNCAYRRGVLTQVGGFDEFFVYYLDETDVCMRMAQAGFLTEHLPENPVRHFSASSERRTTPYDRNWDVITRSDTYFALKNGRDPFPIRFLKTLRYASKKHFFREINAFWRRKDIGTIQWLKQIRKWAVGFRDGLLAGVATPRALGVFAEEPPAFLPFHANYVEHPLRIALLTQSVPGQSSYGGIGRYTFDLACGLHERGHEVHIICRDERPRQQYSLGFVIHGIAAAESMPLETEGHRHVLAKNLGYSLAIQRKLVELAAEGTSFDVVHSSNWDAEAISLIREGNVPVVLMLVSPLAQVIQTEQWDFNDDMRACVSLDRWQIEHADAVCVPSYGVLSSYQKLMGIQVADIPNLQLTPLGIVPDQAPFTFTPGPVKRLLFVGRLERRKGAHILLSILPNLLRQFPDWECDLVGSDEIVVEGSTLKEQFLAQHRGAGWLSRVHFRGTVSDHDLKQYYQQCDLFVAPSLFESFGLIYHEAMQYAKAVIGCRTGGVPEVVEDGVEGLLVPPGDARALTIAMTDLMEHEQLRIQMGNAGRERVLHKTNYRTMAEDLEAVYYKRLAGIESVKMLMDHSGESRFRDVHL